MNLLRIIVEGERDCYFLHNLILQRMAHVLVPQYANGKGLTYDSRDGFAYQAVAYNDVKVQIVKTEGFRQVATIKKHLLDDGDDKLCRVDIVFDADTTGVDNGGVQMRTQVLQQTVAELTKGAHAATGGVGYFLVPDNVQDGDVETLMTAMAVKKFPDYFDPCWAGFQGDLAKHQFDRLSDKSKIYDYIEAASCRCTPVISIKDKQGYNKNLSQVQLWDWSVSALDPLVDFLTKEVQLVGAMP